MRQRFSILLFAGNLTGISIDRLTKFGTTELEGKLGLLTILCVTNLGWVRGQDHTNNEQTQSVIV